MDDSASKPTELTDSPWFWACVFSAMALAGTIAIAPKYETRQRGIELQFEARQRSQDFSDRVEAADGDTAKVIAENQRRSDAEAEYYEGQQHALLVRLKPMLVFLSAVFLVSLVRVCLVEMNTDHLSLFNSRRGMVIVLAIALCLTTLCAIWISYSRGGLATADKTLILVLVGSTLIALAVASLWRSDSKLRVVELEEYEEKP